MVIVCDVFIRMDLRVPKFKPCKDDDLVPYPSSLKNVVNLRKVGSVPQGKYNGNNVIIDDIDHMHAIYYLGFFGKGSLSRGAPDFKKRREAKLGDRKINTSSECSSVHPSSCEHEPKQNKESHDTSNENLKAHSSAVDTLMCQEKVMSKDASECDKIAQKIDCEHSSLASKHSCDNIESSLDEHSVNNIGCEVAEGSNKKSCSENHSSSCSSSKETPEVKISNTNVCVVNSTSPLNENLHLNLEEAYFLAYGLGCLQILDLFGKKLSLDEAWGLFCQSQDDFIQKYVVYHYFRAKGWVVKSGIKFGGDFLLYKFGPHFTHATYIVVIEVVTEDGCISEDHNQPQKWIKMIGLNRLAESSGKDVLLCRVIWPDILLSNSTCSPKVIKQISVQELKIKRWVSSQEREQLDQEEIGKEIE